MPMNPLDKEIIRLLNTAQAPPLEGHQLRFERKLQRQNKPVKRMLNWMSIAASITLLIGFSISPFIEQQEPPAFASFYTQQINRQLNTIEQKYTAEFSLPIEDSKQQLHALEKDYQLLLTQFNAHNNHPLLLNAMIENLQQQLQVLGELENHLKELKILHYENEVL